MHITKPSVEANAIAGRCESRPFSLQGIQLEHKSSLAHAARPFKTLEGERGRNRPRAELKGSVGVVNAQHQVVESDRSLVQRTRFLRIEHDSEE